MVNRALQNTGLAEGERGCARRNSSHTDGCAVRREIRRSKASEAGITGQASEAELSKMADPQRGPLSIRATPPSSR